MSNNLANGEKLLSGKTLTDNVPFFRDLFEVGLSVVSFGFLKLCI